ncbi:MAG: 3-phosphoshikimate 1-carboxyvinyltransferase [Candidatus Omnitrophica bacterium]|nr:3-phosphoshikimate 1-carboxyvinyltransferase [Candidatus Omnitrophota bacterium]
MILKVSPTASLQGGVDLPASKSYSIRAFIIAACGGQSQIIHPSNCDDAQVAKSVAGCLGAHVVAKKNNSWSVKPRGCSNVSSSIQVGESGTVLRFLLPLLPFYYSKIRVEGKGTLKGRPNFHLTEVLRRHGVKIQGVGDKESIPIVFSGGQLKGGTFEIEGSLSSQFVSALLIACPHLHEDSQILIRGEKVVSTDYIVMTRQILAKAGIRVQKKSERSYRVPGRQKFRGLKKFIVPSDYGLAAFLLAAGALIPSDLVLHGHFNDRLLQADGRILNFLKKMGVKYQKTLKTVKLRGPFSLKGGRFSLKDCPDLVPIMAVLALFAKSPTRLCDVAHAKAKESDRLADLKNELLKIGADVQETSDGLLINPQARYRAGVLLDPHHDHRLAMAFSVLGLKLGVRIQDIECVSKSYPDFVSDFKKIGALVKKGS